MVRHFLTLLTAVFAFQSLCAQAIDTPGAYWHGEERELRYTPDGEDFVIVNGKRKFTRALYGTNTAFRLETSDMPEFAMFMQRARMGGNLRLALIAGQNAIWLNDAEYIESRYRPGARIYTIKDPILGGGEMTVTALAMSDADGFILKTEFKNTPDGLELAWIYGGATDARTMSRNGDMNADPERVFHLQPRNCRNNRYTLSKNSFTLDFGSNLPGTIAGIFPPKSSLKIGDANHQRGAWEAVNAPASDSLPVLTGSVKADARNPQYIAFYDASTKSIKNYKELASVYRAAEEFRISLAEKVKIHTPDPFLNTLGGAITMAGDGIWEDPVYQHGAIGWRVPLPGWRGAYTGNFWGWHDRAYTHFRAYGNSQFTNPPDKPVIMDTALNLARSAKIVGTPMYSSGYIARYPNAPRAMNHYDMNIVYIDALLWHLNWTGDVEFAREMWPVIERHLAWEKRCFDPDGDGLYDAYCCIWASDALQYSGGSVTHSTAYNYRSNKLAAMIASKIGVNPEPYEREASKIYRAVNNTLWLKDKGWWAEFKEFGGNERIHPDAGLWTFYHAVDSDLSPNGLMAYQAAQYVKNYIPHIPVRAKNYDDEGLFVVSTTNWLPYFWSINNVAIAESLHTALALWQSGEKEHAFKLFKGVILDNMYMGGSPGNVGQVSFYDASRGEVYRDFADPVGVISRTVVQGLFGIYPDLLNGRVDIRPGYPAEWEFASFHTPDIEYDFKREGGKDRYTIVPKFPAKAENVVLRIPALSNQPTVTLNGEVVRYEFEQGMGHPVLAIDCGSHDRIELIIKWEGRSFNLSVISSHAWHYQKEYEKSLKEKEAVAEPAVIPGSDELTFSDFEEEGPVVVRVETDPVITNGEALSTTFGGNKVRSIKDPQGILETHQIEGTEISYIVSGTPGHRTFFAVVEGPDGITWTAPVNIEIREKVEAEVQHRDKNSLVFKIRNNTREFIEATYRINGKDMGSILLGSERLTQGLHVSVPDIVMGSNRLEVFENGELLLETVLINWEIGNPDTLNLDPVDISSSWNDRVTQIFRNKYLTPRYPYTALQIPVQGIGEWCVPNMMADIDDSGVRNLSENGIFRTPIGIGFTTEADTTKNNIVYTSLWDNYPDSVEIPLDGSASHAYLMMAGSTNHMQCHMVNGTVTVIYKDGTSDRLELINPETWAPIEQDFYVDGEAFRMNQPRPYRVQLSTGYTARDMDSILDLRGSPTNPRRIPGGAATILDLPLNPEKELDRLVLKTESLEVVIGLMGITLVR